MERTFGFSEIFQVILARDFNVWHKNIWRRNKFDAKLVLNNTEGL